MRIFAKIKDFIIDLIFPRQCLSCGKEGLYLCEECKKKIILNQNFYCVFCKSPTNLSEICPRCSAISSLKAVWVASDYKNEILQKLIHALKYQYLEEISIPLADLLINYLQQNKIFENLEINRENSFFQPIPLHKKRYLKRGFNQSELLANHLKNFFQIPKSNLLIRNINTHSQVDLKKGERQENVRNAFTVIRYNNLEANKKVILIDDVVTTGSTLNECAQVLKNAGFSEIYGLVIAQRED